MSAINAAQGRVLRLVEALAGYEMEGRRLTDLAAELGGSLPMTLRDLQSAAAAGWTEQREDGKWRLGPRPVQVAVRFQMALARERERIDECQQRYTRAPL